MGEQTEIRKAVEREYGSSIRYPRECIGLHHAILEKLGKAPSTSTLRRFFGLEKSSSGTSRYTLNLLSRYCGYKDPSHFPSGPDGNTLPLFSKHSYNHLKNKTGAKGKNLVRRESLLREVMGFLKSEKRIFFLNGKAGMGKSSFLLTLFQELKEQNGYEVYLFDMSILGALQSSGVEFISFFEAMRRLCVSKSEKKFQISKKRIFLIDAVDEYSQKFEKQKGAAETLLSIATSLPSQKNPGINYFIFSCRPPMWSFFYERLQVDPQMERTVYGENLNAHNLIIGELTDKEIAESMELSLDAFHQQIGPALRALLRVPLMLKLSRQFQKAAHDQFPSELDLLLNYSLKVIFTGNQSLEKRLLISKLLESVDFGLAGSSPRKKEVFEVITQYKRAYSGLLKSGVLFEQKIPNKYGTFTTYIYFFHEIIFEFLLAQHFLIQAAETEAKVEEVLLHKYGKDELRLKVLLWVIRFKIKEGDIAFLETVIEKILAPYSPEDLNDSRIFREYLVIFRHEIIARPEILRKLAPIWAKAGLARKWFTEIFVNVSRINQYYGELLEAYLSHSETDNDRTFALSLLALRDFIRKDSRAFETRVTALNQIGELEVHPFPMARKIMVNLLYRKENPDQIATGFDAPVLKTLGSSSLNEVFDSSMMAPREFPLHMFIVLQAAWLCKDVELVRRIQQYESSTYPLLRKQYGRYYDCRFMDAIYFWADWKTGKVIAEELLDQPVPAFHIHSFEFDWIIYLLIRAEILRDAFPGKAMMAMREAHQLAVEFDLDYFVFLSSLE